MVELTGNCVECGTIIDLPADAEAGEVIDCTMCGSELEVIQTDPVSLEEAPDLEEDWGE
ncbi:lysine biosynthesis protein LysW [Natrinema sp. H-ect4]|uniref:lysine biosynthesis protein LysW n=1 Tax=Natrinema sp. H-ect4 TaxID=3242699 RepID=UPI0035A895F5